MGHLSKEIPEVFKFHKTNVVKHTSLYMIHTRPRARVEVAEHLPCSVIVTSESASNRSLVFPTGKTFSTLLSLIADVSVTQPFI